MLIKIGLHHRVAYDDWKIKLFDERECDYTEEIPDIEVICIGDKWFKVEPLDEEDFDELEG